MTMTARHPRPAASSVNISDESPRIPRTSLHHQVVSRLREMILDGEIAAGTRVPEKELCGALGISRTPLREALKVLAAEGLVELRPNRGAVVAGCSPESLDGAFDVCEALDRVTGEKAAARLTRADHEELEALHEALHLCAREKDVRGFFEIS